MRHRHEEEARRDCSRASSCRSRPGMGDQAHQLPSLLGKFSSAGNAEAAKKFDLSMATVKRRLAAWSLSAGWLEGNDLAGRSLVRG